MPLRELSLRIRCRVDTLQDLYKTQKGLLEGPGTADRESEMVSGGEKGVSGLYL